MNGINLAISILVARKGDFGLFSARKIQVVSC